MGGPVSSLGEEVWKDSTADGGQGDEQEWWEVKVLRRRPANSRKFELWLFYIFNFYFPDFILQILIFIFQILFLFYRFYFAVFILQILFYFTGFIFYFTDFILLVSNFLFYRFHCFFYIFHFLFYKIYSLFYRLDFTD